MEVLKQNIYILIFQIFLKISLLAGNSTVTDGQFMTMLLRNRRQDQQRTFTLRYAVTHVVWRTPPERVTFDDECEYLSHYCHRTYSTGRVCGRTAFFQYMTFKSYCMLDYVNCRERYEVWELAHMGQCYKVKLITEYLHYRYQDDSFLDKDYVVDDHNWAW